MTSEKQKKKKGKMSWYLMHLLLLVVTGSLLGASKSQSFIGPFSLCFVIGQNNSYHALNQSDAKQKQIQIEHS